MLFNNTKYLKFQPAHVPGSADADSHVIFLYVKTIEQLGDFATAKPVIDRFKINNPVDHPLRFSSLFDEDGIDGLDLRDFAIRSGYCRGASKKQATVIARGHVKPDYQPMQKAG